MHVVPVCCVFVFVWVLVFVLVFVAGECVCDCVLFSVAVRLCYVMLFFFSVMCFIGLSRLTCMFPVLVYCCGACGVVWRGALFVVFVVICCVCCVVVVLL